jgi:hypothetical protein
MGDMMMRWGGTMARMGTMRKAYKTLVGKREGKKPFGRSSEYDRIILKCILRKWCGRQLNGFIWLRIRAGVGLL